MKKDLQTPIAVNDVIYGLFADTENMTIIIHNIEFANDGFACYFAEYIEEFRIKDRKYILANKIWGASWLGKDFFVRTVDILEEKYLHDPSLSKFLIIRSESMKEVERRLNNNEFIIGIDNRVLVDESVYYDDEVALFLAVSHLNRYGPVQYFKKLELLKYLV